MLITPNCELGKGLGYRLFLAGFNHIYNEIKNTTPYLLLLFSVPVKKVQNHLFSTQISQICNIPPLLFTDRFLRIVFMNPSIFNVSATDFQLI